VTRLLISVRDVEEASLAAAAGADLIDLKEPRAGALGAVDPAIWPALRAAVPAATPMSVALGELGERELEQRLSMAGRFQFAKIGLSGWRDRPDWQERLSAAWRLLPQSVTRVAVAYADDVHANSPPPEAILDSAKKLAAGALLIDTAGKQQGSLFDLLDEARLAAICRRARQLGWLVVLAGSLRRTHLPRALAYAPDYVAVRGAVCHPDRAGQLVPERIREWSQALAIRVSQSSHGLPAAEANRDLPATRIQPAARA
jgi:(5-formylfuran-3-yl)methyl phosphate synthase